MIYTTKNGAEIEYIVSGRNCHISNSSLIHNDEDKNEFIEFLVCTNPLFRDRTISSYVREWTAHNILFQHGIKPSSTEATDLNIDEYWWRRLGYYFICCFCREKS